MPDVEPYLKQQTLYPPGVTELTIRVGMLPAENHGQWQYELRAPDTGELLELGSKHHYHLGDFLEEVERLAQVVVHVHNAYGGPFD